MPGLVATDISASYGSAAALFDASFTLAEGEIIGVLGRNGAGKSTLLRSIMNDGGILRQGEVMLGDVSLRGRSTHQIARSGLAWVPDDRRIFRSLSVEENLTLPWAPKRDTEAQLERVVESLPLLKPLLERRGFQLSGGEQQAVAIGRALMAEPKVLLLDEPTEGLSPLVVEQLRLAIAKLPEAFGVSIVLAEQNFKFVSSLVHRVYLLDSGRVAWDGPIAELESRRDLVDKHLSIG